ncbi:MAG: hypothetical protein AB7O56_13730 [Bauldia sp.]
MTDGSASWLAGRRHPGPARRRLVIAIAIAAALVAIGIGAVLHESLVPGAFLILLVSLAAFTLVAYLTPDCFAGWKAVDYPWVMATFVAIVVALTNIVLKDEENELWSRWAERQASFSSLVYAVEAVLANDCAGRSAEGGAPAPEPYAGACDRMATILPDIKLEAALEGIAPEDAAPTGWGADILASGGTPTGLWSDLYVVAADFDGLDRSIEPTESARFQGIIAVAASENLRYWYFILAFFLGLRLSKTTAELLGLRLYPEHHS